MKIGILTKIFHLMIHPSSLLVALDHYGFVNRISDKKYLKILSKIIFGKSFDIDNPVTFNEKLSWLKLFDRNPRYTLMADKYAVKSLVDDMAIEGLHTTKCYGVWNKFDEIDFDILPQRFVLKATHDSSGATICRDKFTFDKNKAKNLFGRLLSLNNFWGHREWVYKNIPPRIIAEEYLDDGTGHELTDYKFWCFNGEPKIMYVTNKGTNIYENFYDMEFNVISINHGFPRKKPEYSCPSEFERMKEYAKQLSKNIPFVRVDFFDVNGKIYFGEFTFYDWAGMRPFEDDWDRIIGQWLDLKK